MSNEIYEKIRRMIPGEYVDYEPIAAEELLGNRDAIDMLYSQAARRTLGKILIYKKGAQDWIYLISRLGGEKWEYLDKNHTGENNKTISSSEAYKKYISRLKPGYVVLRGNHAVKKYNQLKKAKPTKATTKTKVAGRR